MIGQEVPVTLDAQTFRLLVAAPLLMLCFGALVWNWPTNTSARRLFATLRADLGLDRLPLPLFVFGAGLWAVLMVALVGGVLFSVFDALRHAFARSPEDLTGLRGLLVTLAAITATLGAVIALPFSLLRARNDARQTDATEQSLLNDKLDAAFAGLSARYSVPRTEVHNGNTVVLNEMDDDVMTRSIAIDRTLGLAREHPTEVPRIASILSLYVRELSAQLPAVERPEGMTHPNAIEEWVRNLKPARSDLQKAVQVLGRLTFAPDIPEAERIIDLRGANLRRCDLSGLSFPKARFDGAHMEGAILWKAHLEGASLELAHLEGAYLQEAHLEGADISRASLDGANLDEAHLEDANLERALLVAANFWFAHLERADLSYANLEKSNLSGAHLEKADLLRAHMEGVFLRGTHLQGAVLRMAHLEGARFWDTHIDYDTFLHGANLLGASVRGVDILTLSRLLPFRDVIFADGSVSLPPGRPRLAHWADEPLKPIDFTEKWRAWQATLSDLPPAARR